jgi:hypothetical protein
MWNKNKKIKRRLLRTGNWGEVEVDLQIFKNINLADSIG